MKVLALFLALVFTVTPVLAVTAEKHNLMQEMDITFWQTAPFAAFWGYVIDRQLYAGMPVHWNVIVISTTAISFLNAYIHARQVVAEDKP